MPVKTVINIQYIEDAAHELRLSLNELNDLAGLAENRIYHYRDHPETQIRTDTLDRIHNAIESRMVKRGIAPPDDLWNRLTVQTPMI